MNNTTLSTKIAGLSYLGAFIFIMAMVATATYFGDAEIVLPEVAAMAVALLAFREASWMKQPEKIFLFPSLTAIMGFGINMLPIAYLSKIGLVLIGMLLLMLVFRYNLAPALATGFLPIVTNAHNTSFVISILVTTFLLMLLVVLFKLNKGVARSSSVDRRIMLAYAVIMLVWMIISWSLGHPQFAVIPPIAVVVYESLHMKMYTVKMAVKQTAVLSLAAGIGVILFLNLSSWSLVGLLDLGLMFMLLRLFKMHVPAVYAFPFLAFVLPKEVLADLPWATVAVSVFSFGAVLIFKKYIATKKG